MGIPTLLKALSDDCLCVQGSGYVQGSLPKQQWKWQSFLSLNPTLLVLSSAALVQE